MVKVALIYDFDKTLCTKDMQEYQLIPNLGYQNPVDFWKEVSAFSEQHHLDRISAYLYLLVKKYEEQNNPLTLQHFDHLGACVEFYEGVLSWFERVNAYGKNLGLEIEHYIISSGNSEVIGATPIAKYFKKIYACRYYYEDGIAKWPAHIVNYTTKTQYLFRINKQVLDETNDADLNAYQAMENRPIPFHRMIYIADGLTDIPCMKLVKEYGGKSIAVYADQIHSQVAKQLLEENRVDFACMSNYSKGSNLEKTIFDILTYMQANSVLEKIEGELQ